MFKEARTGFINKTFYTTEDYTLFLSYYPEWDEFHLHMDMPRATADTFKKIYRDEGKIARMLYREYGIRKAVYSLCEEGDTQAYAVFRLLKFKPIEEIRFLNKKYIKYKRRR